MRNRTGLIFAAALLTGGIAAFLAVQALQDGEPTETAQARVEVTPVAVAARDLPMGRVLSEEDVRLVEWPSTSVPAGYSTSPAEVVGRGLLVSTTANEPLLSAKLARKEAGGGLGITIPEGMRAMSVKVDEVIGVAGFVLPGTRVDVLVTLNRIAGQEPATQAVLHNVQVLAVDQIVERDPQGEPKTVSVVTLQVNPVQGEKLALGSTEGRVQLALRNPLDMNEVETSGAWADELIRKPVVRRVSRAPGPTQWSVDVYRGPEVSTTKVSPSGGN